jgi:hypothetical protein
MGTTLTCLYQGPTSSTRGDDLKRFLLIPPHAAWYLNCPAAGGAKGSSVTSGRWAGPASGGRSQAVLTLAVTASCGPPLS